MGKFYVTTPIYYVNAAPHLGHAYADVLADVIARYHKFLGDDVFFLTGTDEHGAKNARAAKVAEEEISEFVKKERQIFQNLAKSLNLSNSDFLYTSDQIRHWPGAQKLWKKLEEQGDIYKGTYQGLYCLGHEAFITEKDLIDGKCPDHNEKPQIIEEENYFFRLSKYTAEIKKRIESNELLILPETRRNEILSFLEEGLKDVSFSRPAKDISWGVPVPGDMTQTMYVWCDALSSYISALSYGSEDEIKFNKFWPADLHVIGKDILRFHGAIWPGMLLSAGLALPKAILTTGLIRVGDHKMSKTLGNVVNPFELTEKYGTDALRYYLSREIPVFSDGEFTQEKFEAAYEGNLVNGIGNYARRVTTMIKNYFDSHLERPEENVIASVPFRKKTAFFSESAKVNETELEYFSVPYFINHFILPKYHEAMRSYNINAAANLIFFLLGELDGYVQDYEPFKLIKSDKEKTHVVLWNLAYGLASFASLVGPFLPETSEKILEMLGVRGQKETDWKAFQIKESPPLFPRLSK